MQRSTIVAGITLAAALAVAGGAWYLTLTAEPATSPQRMTWHRADGSRPADPPGDPYPFNGCDGDLELGGAVWRGGVIVSCDNPAIGAGWAWLDPAAKRAELRWPVAEEGPLVRTRGLIPGPGGALAIVFERELQGELFVGIAAARGWSRPPESLGRVLYRAAAWVGPALQVVVTPSTADDEYGMGQPHTIVTIAEGRRTDRPGVPACAEAHCRGLPIAYRAGGRWVFEGWGGQAVAETGEVVASVVPGRGNGFDVDLLAHGKLDVPTTHSLGLPTPVIDADGKAGASPAPPWSGLERGRLVRQNHYLIDERIRRQPTWSLAPGYQTKVGQVDGRLLVWHSDRDDRVRIADDPGKLPSAKPIARWPSGYGGRILYADRAGGYWMVQSDGAHVHLDGALRRTDPSPLREHLRRRGSQLRDGDEPGHERALGWALFGLPLLLAGAYLFGVFTGPGAGPHWRPRPGPIAIAAGVYAVSGLAAFAAVLPLLA